MYIMTKQSKKQLKRRQSKKRSTQKRKYLGAGRRRKSMKRNLRNKRMLGGHNAITPPIPYSFPSTISSSISTIFGSNQAVNPAHYIQPIGDPLRNLNNLPLV